MRARESGTWDHKGYLWPGQAKVLESILSMTESPSLEVCMLQHVSVSHVETLKTF